MFFFVLSLNKTEVKSLEPH